MTSGGGAWSSGSYLARMSEKTMTLAGSTARNNDKGSQQGTASRIEFRNTRLKRKKAYDTSGDYGSRMPTHPGHEVSFNFTTHAEVCPVCQVAPYGTRDGYTAKLLLLALVFGHRQETATPLRSSARAVSAD